MTEQTKQHLHSVEAMLTERLQGQQEQITALFEQFRYAQAHLTERFAKQIQAQKEQTPNAEQHQTSNDITNILFEMIVSEYE